MAVTVVRSVESFGNFTPSRTVSFDSTGCDYVVVLVGFRRNANQSPSSVTYNGASMSQLGLGYSPGATIGAFAYGIAPGSTGTYNVIVTMSGNGYGGMHVTVVGLAGVDAVGTVETSGANSGTALSNEVACISGGLVCDVIAVKATAQTLSANAGQTPLQDGESSEITVGSSYEAGATAVTTGWTWTTSAEHALVQVPLTPALTGGTGPRVMSHRRDQGMS